MPLHIDSDHREAEVLLGEIGRIVSAHGGSWHPQMRCEIRQGGMRILADAGAQGPLITIPTELLVPVDGARWSDGGDRIQVDAPPTDLTPVQLELLHLLVALYNATDKLRWWRHEHPASLAHADSAVGDALMAIRPTWAESVSRGAVTEAFLKTRIFGWRREGPDGTTTRVLMPIVDLLNHHRKGAPLTVDQGAMRIAARQPDGTGECFASYGQRRDLLDFLLHYGHLDLTTPFAHAALTDIEVPGIGRVQVEEPGQVRPLHPLDPPRVSIDDTGIRLSHICCDAKHPERARTMLTMAFQGCLLKRGHPAADAHRLAVGALGALGAANRELLARLAAASRRAEHPAGPMFAEAAERQAEIIGAVLG
jgi:hypothetical protein